MRRHKPEGPVDALFRALADPVRRAIVDHLVSNGDHLVDSGELADLVWDRFRLTWPSTSKHLRVLRDTGIVTSWARTTSRYYELRPDALTPILSWTQGVAGGPR